MKNNYVLIDYENVQPENLAILNGHPFKVIVFVGANQAKIPFELATALQALGSNAEYVKIGGFQLCYGKERDEHALTWRQEPGLCTSA